MWYLEEKVNDEVYFCHVEKHRNWYDKLILPYWMCVSRHSRSTQNKKFTFLFVLFFSIRAFFHRHWRFTGQQWKEGDHLLFHSTTYARSQTLIHLFATLHVRWLSRIFNCNAHVYQTATQWDLPPHRITIWLISWWWNVCLFTW